MALKTYAFLKKEGDDYTILDIKIVPNEIDSIMKFQNHDLAYLIDYNVYELWKDAQINKKPLIFKVKKDFDQNLITLNDIYIINLDELKKKIKTEDKNENLNEEDLNELLFEEEKNKILRKYINYFFPRLDFFDIANTIKLMLLNNKFNSKGYFITDENQEEIFIDIIEKNEELLEDLEKFIEYKTNFEKFLNLFENYTLLKEEIEYLSYWEFDSLDDALSKLKEIYEKYNPNPILNIEKDKEFLLKIKEEIKKRIKNDKNKENKK